MKIVIAPDSLKGSIGAASAAKAISIGVLAACPDASIDLCPIADGGEGTVEAMVAATAGEVLVADVFDPLGAQIRAKFGLLGTNRQAGLPGQVGLSGAVSLAEGAEPTGEASGRTAVIEMASASGLMLVPSDKLDPLRTTSFGTGQLIMAALDAGARDIIVGLGDSATVDGGCGAAQAFGVTFVDGHGMACVCGLAGGGLADLGGLDLSGRDPRLAETKIIAACDVRNPLLGAAGSARVFGPQKGATPEVVELLEANLTRLADLVGSKLGLQVADLPGAGAAGGMGAGLVAFADAELVEGFAVVADAVGLSKRLAGADLCITSEGSFDKQSNSGKVAVGVAQLAAKERVPVVCIPGQASPDGPHEHFAAVRPLVGGEVTKTQAMGNPECYLTKRAEEVVRTLLAIK